MKYASRVVRIFISNNRFAGQAQAGLLRCFLEQDTLSAFASVVSAEQKLLGTPERMFSRELCALRTNSTH